MVARKEHNTALSRHRISPPETVTVDGFALSQKGTVGNTTSATRTHTVSGVVFTQTDGRGNTTTMVTDIAERTLTVTDAAGNVTTMAYDTSHDLPIMITDAETLVYHSTITRYKRCNNKASAMIKPEISSEYLAEIEKICRARTESYQVETRTKTLKLRYEGMTIESMAKALYVHRNTVLLTLSKFEKQDLKPFKVKYYCKKRDGMVHG